LRAGIRKSIEITVNVATIRRIRESRTALHPVDLDRVIREEIAYHGDACITYEGLRVIVLADDLLSEVFTNLIGNAASHGGPDVAVTIRVEDEDGFIRVTVADTGRGIPDDQKEEIFHRYEKKQRCVGEGLGLYLVQILIDRYGGRIWVDDRVPGRPEEGAAFVFTLREAGDDESGRSAEQSP
ncbi:MAG: ATP-binding protein, partial [Methanoculleus sp.]|nr:ATP-binding protein [Methanoculleus sp.]